MTTEERLVPAGGWRNAGGFVEVDGDLVHGGQGVKRVAVRETAQVTCQPPGCGEVGVSWPLVLWVRYEAALGRDMYWFGPGPGDMPRYCGGCLATRRSIVPG